MANSPAFLDYVLDLLDPLGRIVAKPMFGGHGLYLNGTIFAILYGDILYFRVDEQNRRDFEAAGTEPFAPLVRAKPMAMPYYAAPPDALEDGDALCEWARKAYSAALRARKPSTKR